VEPNENHSGCMSAFEDAGIYALIDLDTFTTDIDPVSRADSMKKQYANNHSERNFLESNPIRRLLQSYGCIR
jgi:hypothetical protein